MSEKTDAEIAAETAAAEKAKADEEAKAKSEAEAESQRKAQEERDGKPRTEKEKAAYSLQKNAERLRDLGGDPEAVLSGIDGPGEGGDLDDNKPVTFGDLKRIELEKATKTAEEIADQIEDEKERGLVRSALKSSIRPSGNPQVDVDNARAIVNAEKNRQRAEEAERARNPKRNVSGSGAPGKSEDNFEPTAEESSFMKPPFNLSKEKILENRRQESGR